MKKVFLFSLVLSMLFVTCGCANKTPDSGTVSSVTESPVDSSKVDNNKTDINVKIELATNDQLNDTENYTHFYDTKAISQNWNIVVKTSENITEFCFVELDSSEALDLGDTLFKLETMDADKQVILHTYINDVELNRGISYKDQNGVVRYFGFACDMSGNGDTISLEEIKFS